jgi:hypothetical protein
MLIVFRLHVILSYPFFPFGMLPQISKSIDIMLHRIRERLKLSSRPAVDVSAKLIDTRIQDDKKNEVMTAEIPQILSVPVEILRIICTFLPPEAEVSFSLTCKSTLRTIGNKSWKECTRSNKENKQSLVALLAVDTDDLIHCRHCICLHDGRLVKTQHCTNRYGRYCDAVEIHTRFEEGLPETFRYIPAAYLMKQYRRGLKHEELLNSWNTQKTTRSPLNNIRHEMFKARIANGKLLLRSQEWHIISQFCQDTTISTIANVLDSIAICPHLQAPVNVATTREIIVHGGQKCRITELDFTVSLRRCHSCPTEYQVNAKYVGGRVGIVVTRWKDFGPVLSDACPMWYRHGYRYSKPESNTGGVAIYKQTWKGLADLGGSPAGPIQAAFEEHHVGFNWNWYLLGDTEKKLRREWIAGHRRRVDYHGSKKQALISRLKNGLATGRAWSRLVEREPHRQRPGYQSTHLKI